MRAPVEMDRGANAVTAAAAAARRAAAAGRVSVLAAYCAGTTFGRPRPVSMLPRKKERAMLSDETPDCKSPRRKVPVSCVAEPLLATMPAPAASGPSTSALAAASPGTMPGGPPSKATGAV